MANAEFFQTDCESILSQIKHQEKQMRLKRRWLMGLPTSKSDRKRFEEPEFLKQRTLPESLLREDDIFYETIRMHIEEAFGACNAEGWHSVNEDHMVLSGTRSITRKIMSHLDDLTNKGLYLVATVLTRGSREFEKTRWKMKKVIKDLLPKVLGSRNHSHQISICRQLSQLLSDPKNFREKGVTFFMSRSQSHHAAVKKVLSGLKNLPCEILIAMYRKLKGSQAGMPQLLPRRHGWGRDYLIKQVRKYSERMLSELGEGDELQEPLAKAMSVPGLLLKLTPGFQNSSVIEFYPFSSEVESLQNEIAKAILLLKTKVRLPVLKNLQLLLDPNAKISNRSLRTAIRKMLTEYLFECSEMDAIPKSILETLAIINSTCKKKINSNSQSTLLGCFSKEKVEEEVECILSVSALTKQIVLDLLPDHDFDQEFTDAYMEELEESDDGNDDDDGWLLEDRSCRSSRSRYTDSVDELESTAESIPFNVKPPTSMTNGSISSSPFTPQKDLNGGSVEGLKPNDFSGIDSINPNRIIPSSLSWKSGFHSRMVDVDMNHNKVEGIGRSFMPTDSNYIPSPVSANQRCERCEPECNSGIAPANTPPFISSNFSCGEQTANDDKQSKCKNQYLAIQEVCDETSMVAYNLIGHLLEKLAQTEGLDLDWRDHLYLRGDNSMEEDSLVGREEQNLSEAYDGGSVVVRVIEEQIPSFPKSLLIPSEF
ncbi:hypothetical protein F2P56_015773 [Juglans regia]|uniref:Uncharacterized protein LOC108980324 isoform X2 n=2 Tax=Juglans regia TaxID=51240 RepID=A0A2I4DHX9_JUGRE|nr:uncharacterized protein LOC108980324 isoform X2 [Juglans regia]XP_018806762.1 uncharacterized protein LOC108980324 isoform X2 [Juglans regia]KAF5465799.1 hypothetical protein F2P56_015773 [Juglans regia]